MARRKRQPPRPSPAEEEPAAPTTETPDATIELDTSPVPSTPATELQSQVVSSPETRVIKVFGCFRCTNCELTGEMYYVLLITSEKLVITFQTFFRKEQLILFRRIIHSITSIPNDYALEITTCVNLVNGITIQEFNKTWAGYFVEKMIGMQYLSLLPEEDDDDVEEPKDTLGFRTIREFEPAFEDDYAHCFADCFLCKLLLLNGLQCPNCIVVVHRGCFQRYIESCTNCIQCGYLWKSQKPPARNHRTSITLAMMRNSSQEINKSMREPSLIEQLTMPPRSRNRLDPFVELFVLESMGKLSLQRKFRHIPFTEFGESDASPDKTQSFDRSESIDEIVCRASAIAPLLAAPLQMPQVAPVLVNEDFSGMPVLKPMTSPPRSSERKRGKKSSKSENREATQDLPPTAPETAPSENQSTLTPAGSSRLMSTAEESQSSLGSSRIEPVTDAGEPSTSAGFGRKQARKASSESTQGHRYETRSKSRLCSTTNSEVDSLSDSSNVSRYKLHAKRQLVRKTATHSGDENASNVGSPEPTEPRQIQYESDPQYETDTDAETLPSELAARVPSPPLIVLDSPDVEDEAGSIAGSGSDSVIEVPVAEENDRPRAEAANSDAENPEVEPKSEDDWQSDVSSDIAARVHRPRKFRRRRRKRKVVEVDNDDRSNTGPDKDANPDSVQEISGDTEDDSQPISPRINDGAAETGFEIKSELQDDRQSDSNALSDIEVGLNEESESDATGPDVAAIENESDLETEQDAESIQYVEGEPADESGDAGSESNMGSESSSKVGSSDDEESNGDGYISDPVYETDTDTDDDETTKEYRSVGTDMETDHEGGIQPVRCETEDEDGTNEEYEPDPEETGYNVQQELEPEQESEDEDDEESEPEDEFELLDIPDPD